MAKVRQVEIKESYSEADHSGGTNNGPFILFALSTIFWPIAFARIYSSDRLSWFLGSLPLAYFSYINGMYVNVGIGVSIVAFIVWFVRFLKSTNI